MRRADVGLHRATGRDVRGHPEVGAATNAFKLAHDARTIARNLISLEDGQGLYVLMGRDQPREVEGRIFDYLTAVTHTDRGRFSV